MFSVLLLSVVAVTGIINPILKFTYNPSVGYIAHKRRTIQHAKPDAELRMMVCLHGEKHVAPIVRFLKAFNASKSNPICVYVLHLVQLTGQAAARLGPHVRSPAPSSSDDPHHQLTETDHIMNAFYKFEEENEGGSYVIQPFCSSAPYATMHDDVCSLALDKKVSLVLLPFHMHRAIDGTMESTNAIRNMNRNVLSFAPCSVAVYVDRSDVGGANFVPTALRRQHLGIYFFGGPDDREALAYAMRLVESGPFALTVIRLRLPLEHWRGGQDQSVEVDRGEEAADDEFISHFRQRTVDGQRVVYREEEVRDGEDTVGVIRATSHYFSLLVVGRRNEMESPMTEGLSMWSQYPELGIVGDVLACTDFGGNVSTLVVQQQARVGTPHGAADSTINCNPAALRNRFRWSRRATQRPLAVEAAV